MPIQVFYWFLVQMKVFWRIMIFLIIMSVVFVRVWNTWFRVVVWQCPCVSIARTWSSFISSLIIYYFYYFWPMFRWNLVSILTTILGFWACCFIMLGLELVLVVFILGFCVGGLFFSLCLLFCWDLAYHFWVVLLLCFWIVIVMSHRVLIFIPKCMQ